MSFLEAEEFQRKKALERLNKEEMQAIIDVDQTKSTTGSKKAREEGRVKIKPDYYDDEYTTGEVAQAESDTQDYINNPDGLADFEESDLPNEEEEFEPDEPDDGIAFEAKTKPVPPTMQTKKPVETKKEEPKQELTAQQVYEQGINDGIAIGYKRARLELIEKLMG